MIVEFTIPQLLRTIGIRGYSPQLASAVNKLIAPNNEIEYQQAKQQVTREITGYKNINVLQQETRYTGEIFGLPVFMPLILEAFNNTVDDFFIDSAIVEITRQKNIVTTVVQGRDTSIKEFINNGDFAVKVSGVLASETADYPMQKLKLLHEYLQYEGSISILNEKLNALDINELVITNYSIPPTPFTNIQPFTFNCLSEKPVELIINDL